MNWLKLGNELLNVFRNASIATTIKLYLYFVYFKLYVTLSGARKWDHLHIKQTSISENRSEIYRRVVNANHIYLTSSLKLEGFF